MVGGAGPMARIMDADNVSYECVLALLASSRMQRIASKIVPGGGAILDATGGLFQFRRGRQAIRQAEQSNVDAVAQGDQIQRQLMITAFTRVADKFTWDSAAGRWIKSDA